jgi:hypothetical protein
VQYLKLARAANSLLLAVETDDEFHTRWHRNVVETNDPDVSVLTASPAALTLLSSRHEGLALFNLPADLVIHSAICRALKPPVAIPALKQNVYANL